MSVSEKLKYVCVCVCVWGREQKVPFRFLGIQYLHSTDEEIKLKEFEYYVEGRTRFRPSIADCSVHSHYSLYYLPGRPKVRSAHPEFLGLSHKTACTCVFKPKCKYLHISLAVNNFLYVPFFIFLESYYQVKEYKCFYGSTNILLLYYA